MLVKMIRFVRGYVDFKASGKFPERFLNITSRYGINLWNAHPTKDGLEASMYISDYRKIRLVTKKSKVTTRIKAKHGLPFISAKYKPRIGIPIGAAAGIVLLLMLSNFVWSISLTGNQNVSQTKIFEVLSQNGVKVGAYKNNLNVQSIERETMLEISEIGWMSVNITGNVVSVEIKEKAEKPEIKTETTPCNIKAKCDGVITKVNAKKGTSQVLVGSGVVKGDLLVSGITQTKMNTIQYVHASADVFADVIFKNELSLPLQYDYYCLNENFTDRTRLFFLWCELPCSLSFSSYDDCVYSQKTENLFYNDVILPVGIKTETAQELVKTNVKLKNKTAEKIFENSLLLYEAFEKSDSKVISRKMTVKKDKNGYICNTDYIFNENIAESVDFSVTE